MNRFCIYRNLINSDYTNMVGDLKNCYLLYHAAFNENCAYSSFIDHSKDTYDSLMVRQCEMCHEAVNCRKCYKTFFSVDCSKCQGVFFSKNCTNCTNCFGCANLKNKQYHIFNEPHTKEEYETFLQENLPTTQEKIAATEKRAHKLWNRFPQKYIHDHQNTNATGDYIQNSKNTKSSFMVEELENCKFCTFVMPGGLKDSYDFTHFTWAELLYEGLQIGDQASRIRFSWFVISTVQDIEYSMFIIGSKNIFGSVGIKKKEYCILNKQYSEEEYKALREKIIQQMNEKPYKDAKGREYPYGEFFPTELSPFAYNETAQEYFPISKEKSQEEGYKWRAPQEKDFGITMQSNDIPTTIEEIQDNITEEVIGCAHEGNCEDQCTTAFKIIPQELQFYRRMNLPLPNLCPNCRYMKRTKWRNPIRLHKRACHCAGTQSKNATYTNTTTHPHHGEDHCPNEFETSYAPDRPEIVYCETCYANEIA